MRRGFCSSILWFCFAPFFLFFISCFFWSKLLLHYNLLLKITPLSCTSFHQYFAFFLWFFGRMRWLRRDTRIQRLKKRYRRKPRIHRKRTLRGSGTNDFRHREASSSSSYFFSSSSSSEKNRQEEDCCCNNPIGLCARRWFPLTPRPWRLHRRWRIRRKWRRVPIRAK